MRITGGRLAMAAVLALFLGAGTAGAAVGAGPSPAVLVKSWAWATVRQPAVNSIPGPKDRGNLLGGGAATVTHLGPGSYRVNFPGAVTAEIGIAHVSTFGVPNRVCVITSYGPAAATINVFVTCTAAVAIPADSTFTVTYLAETGGAGPLAYLYADHPGPNPYPAALATSYNSTGGANAVRILGLGQYRVKLPGLGNTSGDIQVTPVTPPNQPRFCEVASWAGNASLDLIADIRCYKPSGVLAHTRFTFSWNKNVGLKGDGGTNVAYALGNQPANPGPYVPAAPTRYNSAAGGHSVIRTAAGRYAVEVPGMPLGGAAVVTPYGVAGNRCFVKEIRRTALPQRVGVACVNGAGGYADTQFMVSYLK